MDTSNMDTSKMKYRDIIFLRNFARKCQMNEHADIITKKIQELLEISHKRHPLQLKALEKGFMKFYPCEIISNFDKYKKPNLIINIEKTIHDTCEKILIDSKNY